LPFGNQTEKSQRLAACIEETMSDSRFDVNHGSFLQRLLFAFDLYDSGTFENIYHMVPVVLVIGAVGAGFKGELSQISIEAVPRTYENLFKHLLFALSVYGIGLDLGFVTYHACILRYPCFRYNYN
jgi:hypothetical protein